MARTSKKGPQFNIKPLVDFMGLKETIEQIGTKDLVEHLFANPKHKKMLLAALLKSLSEVERAEFKRKLAR